MKILKTIVATAVIVFAMTTVAMAGVQHFTKQSGQASGSQAQNAQPTYAVTLTAAQLARLMNDDQSGSHVGEAQRAKTHARRVHREHARRSRAPMRPRPGTSIASRAAPQGGSVSQSSSHHYETSQQTHVSNGGHDSGHSGGHGGD